MLMLTVLQRKNVNICFEKSDNEDTNLNDFGHVHVLSINSEGLINTVSAVF